MALDEGNQGALDLTFKADAAFATMYVAVKLDTSNEGQVSLADNGEQAIGILQSTAAAAGDPVQVRVAGTTVVKANAAFAIGAVLNSAAATGKVDDSGSTEYSIAVALEAATAQDDEVKALIRESYK